jgi:hypothetical protein
VAWLITRLVFLGLDEGNKVSHVVPNGSPDSNAWQFLALRESPKTARADPQRIGSLTGFQ